MKSLAHQRKIISHLVAQCPRQHGLLVAHQMGGGKTFTALLFLLNYPRRNHVIVCPDFLRPIYSAESVKLLGKPLDTGRTSVITYEQLASSIHLLKGCVLVMDEAHKLIGTLAALPQPQRADTYLALMNAPHRALIMTGTPMQESVLDLRLLVNLAAGREVMPFRDVEYINRYSRPHWTRTVFWGYFVSGITSEWNKYFIGAGALMMAMMARNTDIVPIFTRVAVIAPRQFLTNVLMPVIRKMSILNEVVLLKIVKDMIDIRLRSMKVVGNFKPVRSFVVRSTTGDDTIKDFMNDLQEKVDVGASWIDGGLVSGIFESLGNAGGVSVRDTMRDKGYTLKAHRKFPDQGIPADRDGNVTPEFQAQLAEDMVRDAIRKDTSGVLSRLENSNARMIIVLCVMLLLAVVVLQFMYTLKRLQHHVTRDPMFYRILDYEALRKDLSKYVSFFRIMPGTHGVPRSSEEDVMVVYTPYQTRLWTRMAYNMLTDADLRELGMGRTDMSADGSYFKQVTDEVYENWGRMISNTGPNPPKFVEMWKKIGPVPRRVVIYSDFDAGTRAVVAWLRAKQPRLKLDVYARDLSEAQTRDMLARFSSGNTNVLVLGAGIYEGVSILGAEQMHILDTPTSYASFAQLLGRVVRMHSHDTLPPERRFVRYFLYTGVHAPSMFALLPAALTMMGNKVAYASEILKLWTQSGSYTQTLPGSYRAAITQTTTAEAYTQRRMYPLRQFMRDLESKIATGVDLPAPTCCPTYESEDPSCGLKACENP